MFAQPAAANAGDPVAMIELSISCEKLINMDTISKTDAYVVVQSKDPRSGQWSQIGKTETIDDDLNPKFTKKIKINYLFEVVQELKFVVYDYDSKTSSELVGETACVLTDILLSETGFFKAELKVSGQKKKSKKSRGWIVIHGDDCGGPSLSLTMSFSATKVDRMDMFGKSDPFLVLSRVRDNGSATAAAKTEVHKHTLDPVWKPVKTSSQALCGGNEDAIVRIECFDWNKRSPPDFIGSCDTTVRELKKGNCSWPLINAKKQRKKGKKYKNSGLLRLTKVECVEEGSFFDFLQAGLEIQVMTGVDFTASNGNPSFANSLHHINPYTPNEYQTALLSVGRVLEPYDHDKKIPMYGFGGVPAGHTNVQHVFPMNGHKKHPEVLGVAGMLETYQKCIGSTRLSGPTVLAPIIQAAADEAQQEANDGTLVFTVLLILTDGVYTDRQQTIDAIVRSSALPLSIIIVGVGAADFERMEELDADDTRLTSSTGQVQKHDNVQFVPFRDFKTKSQSALAAEVLDELPGQVVKYFQSIGITKPPKRVIPAVNPASMSVSTSSKPPGYDDIQLDDASSDDEGLMASAPPAAVSYPDLYGGGM